MSNQANKSILILNGNTRTALAVTRSLGKAGFNVFVAAESEKSLAGSSRYSFDSLTSPSIDNTGTFHNWLLDTLSKIKPTVLLPLTDSSLASCYEIADKLPSFVHFPFVSKEIFLLARDKEKLSTHAQTIGVKVPKTCSISADLSEISFPAVLKPMISNLSGASRSIHYLSSKEHAEKVLSELSDKNAFFIQEQISGIGVGVFALYKQGQLVSIFSHKRVLEKPPSGGVSVLSESLPSSLAPEKDAIKLLDSLNWHGVAMVEFKQDQADNSYLLEINPRFWGSLQLSIDAGVDFPKLLVEQTLSEHSIPPTQYQTNAKLRWELGTVDHMLIRFKNSPLEALKAICLENALHLFSGARWEVMRLNDIRPFFFELSKWITRK